MIELDTVGRRLHLDVSDAVLAERRSRLQIRVTEDGDYTRRYVAHVTQADSGADFDFLIGCRGAAVPANSHEPSLSIVMDGAAQSKLR